MTLALAFQTDTACLAIALRLPAYRPSILLWVIAALGLAVAGLAIDALLFPAAIGTVSLWLTSVATGMALGLLAQEVRRILLCADLQ